MLQEKFEKYSFEIICIALIYYCNNFKFEISNIRYDNLLE